MAPSTWAKIIGQPPAFTLEARIFNAICFVSSITVFLTVILNLLLGISQLVILMAVIFVTAVICYYFSRYKGRLDGSVIAYMIAINILLVVNYKYNSGINGPTLLIFIFAYFLTISIVPKKQYWFWVALNLVTVFALLFGEYKYPGLIKNTYADNQRHFIDIGYTYVSIVFFISVVTISVRKNYHTERKLVEQKASELENLNATKNKLFSILAHDLRAPLSSIQNYLEILADFKLSETEKQSIEKDLLNSTQNTQQMLSNLLFWSKSQMDGVTANMVSLNLKETLQSTLHIQKTMAAEKGIQLTDQLKSFISVTADADMLQLIVRNLINNAIKFTGVGGEIKVAANVTIDDCRITIKDNGVGILYEQQDEIFSLKGGSTPGTKNEKGVGLGLLLCKEFTELQGGKITFDSTPGEGTTFYLNFKTGPAKSENHVPDKRARMIGEG